MTQNDIWKFAKSLLTVVEDNRLYLDALVDRNKEIERLQLIITNAIECIDGDDVISASELLHSAVKDK